MGYYVSRQHYYYSGENVVEIEPGGLDYSGPDMLTTKYPGEGVEFDDPRDAVEAAIRIRDSWRADAGETVHISYGQTTGGMGMEHESDDTDNDEAARDWARRRWDEVPKCDRCGEALPTRRDGKPIFYYNLDLGEDSGRFCSEVCCGIAHEEENDF
jgi:hypothetical protein